MKDEITITVTDQTGIQHTLICPLEMGLTLKDICKAYELPMEAMCGGMAMCATCHCYILNGAASLSEKNDVEEALLSELFTSKEISRLACQIYLTAQMDGLSIEIAAD
ncbi:MULTISPECIES: 2Fe-2S iron-sulfur cluster-binding protein [Chryseobacterium]|uniref:Ferredoxin n=1 Tax=Chryseobacterium pennae TaxID=2258962 RepID=A0A3D9C2T8_9FLAO|nr:MULTISPECIES: 2Fe-2S iron-sulfur cluster-binding protein [Chryseobacterium]MCS4304169.1 2Fe-2S ferredoxin [Chryseobacterium sp. BIGb0232]REC59852.1 ferredoxin [Chryseobacterium pennae]ROS17748.1 2Fe-2S ferredoxin [Chryseobacterium nakagawai]